MSVNKSEELFPIEEAETPKLKIHAHDRQGWVSLFYKSCRIGDAQTALICAEVIRAVSSEFYVALTLNQLVGEDLHPIYYKQLFPLMAEYLNLITRKIQKSHNLWQNVYLLAKAPKWYMDKVLPQDDANIWNGLELEQMRQKVVVELGLRDEDKMRQFLSKWKFPDFTWDRHTIKGYHKLKDGTADLSLDGKWDNRYNIKQRFDSLDIKNLSYNQILSKFKQLFK